jgi:hypothetical protein
MRNRPGRRGFTPVSRSSTPLGHWNWPQFTEIERLGEFHCNRRKEYLMLDFGGILAAVFGLFESLFGAILAPLFELIGGVFPVS